jgi:hypothetical protein
MTPLPLPKSRFLRTAVLDLYVLVLVSTPYLCWTFVRHGKLGWGHFVEWAVIIALSSVMSNIDYYDWRNRRGQSYKITPDRDEVPSGRKPVGL